MTDEQFVTVSFTDGHTQRWPLPLGQTAADAAEDLRRVIASCQWFQPPDSTKMYSPYAIVAVDIAPTDDTTPPPIAHRLGEVVTNAISPNHETA